MNIGLMRQKIAYDGPADLESNNTMTFRANIAAESPCTQLRKYNEGEENRDAKKVRIT